MNTPDTCPECGAPQTDRMNCWEQLGGILAWEAHDAELANVHFLAVASYNLQHPAQFTDEALAGLRAALRAYLDEGVPAAELRRRAARAYQGNRRVLRPGGERQLALRRWPTTIADVYLPDQPDGAAERVRQWARSINGEW